MRGQGQSTKKFTCVLKRQLRVGDALTVLRMRGELDPKEKEEIEKVMVGL